MRQADVPSETFQARFGRLRKEAGLTQTALAAPRYSVSYVSQIESGRRNPSPEALRFFAGRMNTTEQYLRTGIPAGLEEQVAFEIEEARLLISDGQAGAALERLRSIRSRIERFGIGRQVARISKIAAEAHLRVGRYRDAIDHLEEAIELGLGGPEHGVAVATLARAYAAVGDLAYAAQVAENFLDSGGSSPLDPALVAQIHTVLVSIYFERGDVHRAERSAKRALEASGDLGPQVRANALWGAARVLAEQRRFDEALEYVTRARFLIEESDDHRRRAAVHNMYAFLCLEQEPPKIQEARRHLDAAEALLEPTDRTELAYVCTERSRLAFLKGNPAEALEHADRALALAGEDRLEHGRSLFHRAQALAQLGDSLGAAAGFEQAAGIFSKAGARQQEASCWREIGDLELLAGRLEAGLEALRSGLEALDPKRSRP